MNHNPSPSTTDPAFDHLVAFQQESAREVGNRRHHAECAAAPESTKFRDAVRASSETRTLSR